MTSFPLVITRSVLHLTLPVTQLLQGLVIDIADATHLNESLKALLVANAILLIPFIKRVTVILLKMLAR